MFQLVYLDPSRPDSKNRTLKGLLMYSNFIRAMKPRMNAFAVATIFLVGLPGALAQDEAPEEKETEKRVDTTVVIGEADDILDVPGSGAVLTSEDLARQAYDDANQALRTVSYTHLTLPTKA